MVSKAEDSSSFPLPRILAVVGVLGLCYAGALVVRDALAAFSAVPALSLMQEWEQRKMAMLESATIPAGPSTSEPIAETFSPDDAEWRYAHDSLERAIQLAPGNPELYANMGRLYQYKFEDNHLPLEEISASANSALEAFYRAAQLRPTWPYHWWDIARTEYVLQRSQSAEFRQALDNSVRFGPWLNDVQLFAADLALEHWESLGAESRQLALANLDRALQRSPEFVPDIVAAYQAWEPLCEQAGLAAAQPLEQLRAYCADEDLRERRPYFSLEP